MPNYGNRMQNNQNDIFILKIVITVEHVLLFELNMYTLQIYDKINLKLVLLIVDMTRLLICELVRIVALSSPTQ